MWHCDSREMYDHVLSAWIAAVIGFSQLELPLPWQYWVPRFPFELILAQVDGGQTAWCNKVHVVVVIMLVVIVVLLVSAILIIITTTSTSTSTSTSTTVTITVTVTITITITTITITITTTITIIIIIITITITIITIIIITTTISIIIIIIIIIIMIIMIIIIIIITIITIIIIITTTIIIITIIIIIIILLPIIFVVLAIGVLLVFLTSFVCVQSLKYMTQICRKRQKQKDERNVSKWYRHVFSWLSWTSFRSPFFWGRVGGWMPDTCLVWVAVADLSQALKRFGISKCVGMTPDLKGDAGRFWEELKRCCKWKHLEWVTGVKR